MRLLRVAAFLVWALVASLAIAGFAAFSPRSGGDQAEAGEGVTTVVVRSDWGSLAGRVTAQALTIGLRSTVSSGATLAAATPSIDPEPRPVEQTPTTSSTTTTVPLTTTTHTHATTTTLPRPTTTTAPPSPPAETTSTTTTSTTTTYPSTFRSVVERWRPLVEQYFDTDDVDRALSVIECESGGNPNATNTQTGAAGLFQHLVEYWEDRAAAAGWPGADIYDPEPNTAVAAWLAYSSGWYHWGSCA